MSRCLPRCDVHDFPVGWPNDLSPGRHMLDFSCWRADEATRWETLCEWLDKCPTLVDVRTFWHRVGDRYSLLVTGRAEGE